MKRKWQVTEDDRHAWRRETRNLRDLEISPSLWAGIGLVRPGPGTAICRFT